MLAIIASFTIATAGLLAVASLFLPRDELLQAGGFCVATAIMLIVILSL